MPNDWELRYGLDPNRYDAEGDLDGLSRDGIRALFD